MSSASAAEPSVTATDIARQQVAARRASKITALLVAITIGFTIIGSTTLAFYLNVSGDEGSKRTLANSRSTNSTATADSAESLASPQQAPKGFNQLLVQLRSTELAVQAEQTNRFVQRLRDAEQRWQQDFDSILFSIDGRRIAASPEHVVQFIALQNLNQPERTSESLYLEVDTITARARRSNNAEALARDAESLQRLGETAVSASQTLESHWSTLNRLIRETAQHPPTQRDLITELDERTANLDSERERQIAEAASRLERQLDQQRSELQTQLLEQQSLAQKLASDLADVTSHRETTDAGNTTAVPSRSTRGR